ncbi:EamA/RhaT family transporter [Prodigiosinella confusarubida]|uniref:Threonine/homoserine exporter RhtA n=1 Tax=Serratia sp. (strain ATCC 39006) TaxID=104623 RepID=A0A2I5TJ28_SERS3|nr:DMT family transporter [Serratia sp. ATCC 39006]AUH00267.1 EamA/RhaT family transporter [Serratia sp. ATCC 39006]AUH04587.1 EamA/RhaT family transporter [Serratia sp. ATCC 39006]
MAIRSLWLTFFMALIWGTSFPVSKIAIDIIGPYAFRVAGSLMSCLVIFIFFNKTIISSFKMIDRSAFIRIFIIAVPNVFLVPTLNSIALHYISVTNATILVYTMPCFTSLILMAISGKVNIISLFSLVLCLSGIMFILKEVKFGLGEAVILCSAIFWAVGAIISQKIVSTIPFKARLFWQMLMSTILVCATYPFFQSGELLQPISKAFVDPRCLMSVLYLGIVGNAVAYYIWFYLIQNESAEYASYATLLSPVITVIIASSFLNEIPSIRQIVGFILILTSAVLVNFLKPFIMKLREAR